jgi:hypothetical protein
MITVILERTEHVILVWNEYSYFGAAYFKTI